MSTSVKGVDAVMTAFMSNISSSAKSAGQTSFQEVWNNQTGKNSAFEDGGSDYKKVSELKDKAQPGESLKAKGNGLRDKQLEEATAKEPDAKELEEAMETLNTAAMELMQEIADAFGMPMEELQQLMADMNMDTMDVLDPAMLSALLLKAGDAENSFALLTNEELYADFQMLMNAQKDILAELGDELELVLAKQLAGDVAMDADALDIEVNVDEDAAQIEEVNSMNAVQGGTEEKGLITKTEDTAKEQAGKDANSNHENGHTGNLVLDTMKADAFKPELQQTAESRMTWDVDTQNIMRQIMDYMKINVKADVSSLEMQLYPAHLGSLHVQVASKGGVLTANFVTENEAVKTALENQMVQLKESFAEQGVKVEAIEVTVQTHEFERNLEQGRGRHQEEPERKTKVRRINLNSNMGMEELEELDEEEQLAAEMMAVNGGTVDYTV